jgi:hypothetical protein
VQQGFGRGAGAVSATRHGRPDRGDGGRPGARIAVDGREATCEGAAMRNLLPMSLFLAGACATTPPAPSAPTRAKTPPPAATAIAEEEAPSSGDPLAAPPDVAAPPAGAEKTASGLASRLLRRGTGTVHPGTFSVVRVDYTGWTTDGAMFDSSVKRGAPAEFPLNGVIAGWRQGVKMMVVGEKRRFWIPEELAYKGMSGPQGMLVFDVELLAIVQP